MIQPPKARVPKRIALSLGLALSFSVAPAEPAFACSCASDSVTNTVRTADAVYVARPGGWDLWPGDGLRVRRVLKGPAKSNLRVRVARMRPWSGSSCAVPVIADDYVIPVFEERAVGLNLCSSYLRGAAAVAEAEGVLGAGQSVAWRPDGPWLAQWALIPLMALAFLARVILRRRRSAEVDPGP